MEEHCTPIVVISKCLEQEACRYNGEIIRHSFIKQLSRYLKLEPVCPEVEMGMGVPREPLRIVTIDGKKELYQPTTQSFFTDRMNSFCEEYFSRELKVDGFILKNRSPSCGLSDVKVFQGLSKSAASKKDVGFFGGEIKQRFHGLPMEDEGRLNNFFIREHFLTALYTFARFREAQKGFDLSLLLQFHRTHKLLFMSYNQTGARRLGNITANREGLPNQRIFLRYFDEMKLILNKAPRFTAMINALMHAFGGFSSRLSAEEKKYFLQTIEEYRDERIPVSTVTHLLLSWAIRFETGYLLDQYLFKPFPKELVHLTNTGKSRF